MATAPYTLIDLAKRAGIDQQTGLQEDVIYNAPEVALYPTKTYVGTSYRTGRVTSFPASQFAQVGGGSVVSKSTFDQKVQDLFLINQQLEVPEEIVQADEGASLEDLLTGEASRALKSTWQLLGSQIYYGLGNDKNGFSGLQAIIGGVSGFEIDASAGSPNAAGSNSSAYLVRMGPDGVALAVGKAGMMNLKPWRQQQVSISGSGLTAKKTYAYTSAFIGYFGLSIASNWCAWRIKNISSDIGKNGGTTFNLTDKLGAQLLATVPQQFRSGLRWFMTRDAAYSLQASRTAVTQQVTTAAGDYGWSGEPTQLAGFPITVTDSLKNPVLGSGGE